MNYNVLHLPLDEVFKKYLGYLSSDFVVEGANRLKTLCPFHNDSDPSLVIYDNRESTRGDGFFYTCLVCGAKGTAVDLLVRRNLSPDSTKAESLLRADFGLSLPLEVRIDAFCKWKGLDIDLCTKYGWENNKIGFEIPYYDENRTLIGKKIRTKYEGKDKYFWSNDFPGKDFHYGWHLLPDYDPSYIIFVEGETDFMTLRGAGFQVIGIPSVNSFLADKYAHKYEKFHKHIILRDQDKWGIQLVEDVAEAFPCSTYELLMVMKQKDTNDFFNFGCGRDIDKFKARINLDLLLPTTVETAETYLHTHAELIFERPELLAKIFLIPKTPVHREKLMKILQQNSEYSKKTIEAEVKTAIQTTYSKGREVTPTIFEDDNCYKRFKISPQGGVVETTLSNFIIRPVFTIHAPDGHVRVVRLMNSQGDTSGKVRLTASDLASTQAFNTKVMSSGNFNYSGDPAALNEIIQSMFELSVPVISTPPHIGRLEGGHWLLGNCGIDAEGKVVMPDEDGNIVLGGKRYQPLNFTGEEGTSGLPSLDDVLPVNPLYRKRLVELLVSSYGTYGVLLGLGALYSSVMSEHVHAKYQLFPILFVTGKRNSGKSTFCTQLYTLFGFKPGSTGASFASTTRAGMQRMMTYFKSMPVFFDDYRNNAVCTQKNPVLLDVYNRQGRVRATGANNSTNTQKDQVLSTAIVSGEDIPDDSALQSRCVTIELSGNEGARSFAILQELEEVIKYVQPYILEVMSRSTQPQEVERFFSLVDKHASLIFQRTEDPRQSKNVAVAMASLEMFFGDVISENMMNDLLTFVSEKTTEDHNTIEDSHAINSFISEVGTLVRDGLIRKEDDYLVHVDKDGKKHFCFRMLPVYTAWFNHYGRQSAGSHAPNRLTILAYLKAETFCEGTSVNSVRFKGRQVKYVDLCVTDMPSIYNDFKEDINEDHTEY